MAKYDISKLGESIVVFYSQWDDNWRATAKVLDKLDEELGCKIPRREVYNNYKNKLELETFYRDRLNELDQETLSFPYYINNETGVILCGTKTVEELKAWAGSTKPTDNPNRPGPLPRPVGGAKENAEPAED